MIFMSKDCDLAIGVIYFCDPFYFVATSVGDLVAEN